MIEKRISQTDLAKLYQQEVKNIGKTGIEQVILRNRNTEKDSKKQKSIFLSHCHTDKMIVKKIILLFNKLDVNIYVDWMDKDMPSITNKETATLIEHKIQHSNHFLFLATAAALQSKWCSWELGIAYSKKGENKMAILPIESRLGNWKGNEYLHLYPVMVIKEDDLEKVKVNEIIIKTDGKKSGILLEEWLLH